MLSILLIPCVLADEVPQDRIAMKLRGGPVETWLEGDTPLEKLRAVLALLHIPEESQSLVFSKTSLQNPLIHPRNPRSLYFNEHSYVGYVPGGEIEIITHDPLLGQGFYTIDPGNPNRPPTLNSDSSSCLSCHDTSRTENVPGVLIRSVHPDENGHLLLSLGSSTIDHRSPINERWGGYYVTGRSTFSHFGNRTFNLDDGRDFTMEKIEMRTVTEQLGTAASRYPRQTSDIVALMILEHQCHLHNLLNAAAAQYRRATWLARTIDPSADPDQGTAGRYARESAATIAEMLLFKDEAELGENGISGDEAFQDAFHARFPKSDAGRSLADFNLHNRLFKYRCSYMVYSPAFQDLPATLKGHVIGQLRQLLSNGEDSADWISNGEKRRIVEILTDTLPAWKG